MESTKFSKFDKFEGLVLYGIGVVSEGVSGGGCICGDLMEWCEGSVVEKKMCGESFDMMDG